jgi:hypothetical protein
MSERLLRVLSSALVLGLLWSCGGGKSEDAEGKAKEAKGAAAVEKSQASAEKAKDDAQKIGADKYAPKQWGEAEQLLAEGVKALEEESDAKTAKLRFDKARSKFGEASSAAAAGKKSFDDIATLKKDLAVLQRKAKEAGAEKGAAELYASAVEKLKSADEAAKESPKQAVTALRAAKQDFTDAIAEANNAQSDAKKKDKEKARAEEEKKLALEEQKKADELGAEKTRAADYGAAKDMLTEGDRSLADGNYDEALNSYQGAKDEFRRIVQDMNESKGGEATGDERGPSAGPDTAEPIVEPREEAHGVTKKGEEAPPPPTGDAAVWAFIEQNKETLFNCRLVEFNGGMVTLNYTNGAELEKDAMSINRPSKASKLNYTRDEMGSPVEMSFEAGGSANCMIVKPQFVRQVRATVTMDMGVVGAGGGAFVLLEIMVDKSGTGLASKFGAIAGAVTSFLQFKSGAKTTVTDTNKAPSMWVKKEKKDWSLELRWPEGQDAGALIASFGGKEVSKVEGIKQRNGAYPSGRVAIAWNSCMFIAKGLKIEGVLDQKWAIEELKRLKVEIPAEITEALGGKPAEGAAKTKEAAKPKEDAAPAKEDPAPTEEKAAAPTTKKSGEVEY